MHTNLYSDYYIYRFLRTKLYLNVYIQNFIYYIQILYTNFFKLLLLALLILLLLILLWLFVEKISWEKHFKTLTISPLIVKISLLH